MGWTHERLVTARNGLDTPIRRGRLSTFLDPELTADGPVPSTNNRLEGGVSAPLREMPRPHRGMGTRCGAPKPCSGGATCTQNALSRRRRSCRSCPPTTT